MCVCVCVCIFVTLSPDPRIIDMLFFCHSKLLVYAGRICMISHVMNRVYRISLLFYLLNPLSIIINRYLSATESWSLPKHENLTKGKKEILWERGEIVP